MQLLVILVISIICYSISNVFKNQWIEVFKPSLINHSINSSYTSKLFISESDAYPSNHAWSYCQYCGYINNEFIRFNDYSKISHDLSWSQWSEFFYTFKNDQFTCKAQSYRSEDFVYLVDRPIYILPMITFHIGHILVDLIEPIYYSMMKTYGEIRLDAIIILDCSGEEERKVLHKLIDNFIESNNQALGKIIKLFTNSTIYTSSLFTTINLNHGIIFSNLHLGLDISNSFMTISYLYQPCLINKNSKNSLVSHLSSNYLDFQSYILTNMYKRFDINITNNIWNEYIYDSSPGLVNYKYITVLFIRRNNTRMINNINELANQICLLKNLTILQLHNDIPVVCMIEILEEIRFDSQLQLFNKADIVIGIGGTAIHNLLFMRSNTIVIIIMQSQWCEYSWMYANQAILLDIQPFIYCHVDDNIVNLVDNEVDSSLNSNLFPVNYRTLQWSRHFWKQGPRFTKNDNITIDIDKFNHLFGKAFEYLLNNNSYSSDSPICPGISPADNVIANFDLSTLSYTNSYLDNQINIYVNYITITESKEFESYRLVELSGVIGSNYLQTLIEFGRSTPDLSVCSIYISKIKDHICIPIYWINYYGKLLINVQSEVLITHLWLQLTNSSYKVIDSDVYIIIDSLLDDGGYVIHTYHYNYTTIYLDINLSHYSDSNSNTQTFIYRYQNQYSLQRTILNYCTRYRIYGDKCGYITLDISKYMYRLYLSSINGFPLVQYRPSPTNPFVFIHIEKSAGTTFREIIVESAIKYQYEYIIPCHNPITCFIFNINNLIDYNESIILSNISIIAGHFSYNIWNSFPTIIKPHSFVMGRHPVDRIISYYYQRCYHSPNCVGYHIQINNLSINHIESLLYQERNARFIDDNNTLMIVDDGMSNAACRAIINKKHTTGLIIGIDEINLPDDLSDSDIYLALSKIETCVVGLVDRWLDTVKILNFYFPWIDTSKDIERKRLQTSDLKETFESIRVDIKELIIKYNQCDMLLYNKMIELFNKQLDIIESTVFVDR